MFTVVIDLYDSGILISDGKRVLAQEASCAYIESDTSIHTCETAQRQACARPQDISTHFWSQLSQRSTTRHPVPHAEIALLHLQAAWARLERPAQRAILAVPGTHGRQDLGLVLGICEKLSIPVCGIVHRAVLAVPGPFPGCTLAWLDVLQQHTVLTELRHDRTGVSVPHPGALLPQGLQGLNHTLTKGIAGAFIANTRYDPLQKAEDEQRFREMLPRWLAVLESEQSVECTLRAAGQEHRIRLHRNEALEFSRGMFEALAERLGSLFRDRGALGLVCAPSCRQLFGLEAFLKGLPGCAVQANDPVDMAGQALRYAEQIATRDSSVHYTTSLAWDRDTSPQVLEVNPGSIEDLDNRPTHLLIGAQAWPLDREVCLSAHNAEPRLSPDMACDENSLCRISRSGWLIEIQCLQDQVIRLNGEPLTVSRSVQAGDLLDIDGCPDEMRFIRIREHEAPLD